MGDADRRLGLVDVLAAGARRLIRVDLEIFRVDLDLDVLGLGENRDGRGRRVHAALRFGDRDALDAVHATLILEEAVWLAALDRQHDLLEASGLALTSFARSHLYS